MSDTPTLASIAAQLERITKGPWKCAKPTHPPNAEQALDFAIGGEINGKREIIAECFGQVDRKTFAPAEANAAFIAAAPTNIAWLIGEVGRLKGEVEAGLQISGSFFEALKPLNLQAINTQNPGVHVTEIIQKLAQAEARCEWLEWFRKIVTASVATQKPTPRSLYDEYMAKEPKPQEGEG